MENILINQENNELNAKVENNVENQVENNIETEVTEEKQNQFLQTTIGKKINTAIDIVLKAILPDMIEEQIIDIKNTMLNSGLKEGINCAINSAIDLGKSAIGIATGNFENLSQVHTAIKKGGIIDSISEVINNVVSQASKNKLISTNTSKLIKKGKNAILDTISDNIEDKFLDELKSLEKVSKYISNWNNYYNSKDIEGMEKEYNKIKKQIKTITPLQNTLDEVKKIENMHTLLKNKGVDYELSEVEKELINRLK